MDGSSANGSDCVRGSGVRKKWCGFQEGGNAQAAQSVGTWSLGDRKLCFLVLDVTYQEDRSHARKIGGLLHAIRCMAINVIRCQGFRYVPDGRRSASARSDRGFTWLNAR
jgi:hypothetical protein